MKSFFKTALLAAVISALFSCKVNMPSPESSLTPEDVQSDKKTAVNVIIPALKTGVVKRTVKPDNDGLVEADYYTVVLTSAEDNTLVYSASSEASLTNSVELSIPDVKLGSYKAEATAYLKQSQDTKVLLYEGKADGIFNVTVSGDNKVSIPLKAVNKGENLTGSVNITLDWTDASALEGVLKDVVSSYDITAKFFYTNNYASGEFEVIDLVNVPVGTTATTFTTSSIPVTGAGYGYFGLYYTKNETEYLLLNVGGETFQIYSNQVSVPENADLYKVTGDNIPSEINAVKLTLGYGEDPTKDLKVSWVNTDEKGELIYEEVSLVLKKIDTGEILEEKILNGHEYASQNASYTFEYNLTRGDKYVVYATARTPYGRETNRFVSNEFTPKVLVESVVINESTMPESYIIQGDGFKLNSVVLPEDATIKDMEWSFEENGLFSLTPANINATSVNLVAIKPGMTKITASSKDNKDVKYTTEKTVSIRLRPVKAPSVTESTQDGGKSLTVTWTPEDGYATSYEVYRYVNGNLEAEAVAVINIENGDDCKYVDKNLYANTSYAYAIKSLNNSLKTAFFDPASELSAKSDIFTPVIPTVTFTQPSIDSFNLQINNADIQAEDILVTPDSPQTLCIPEAIEGGVKYSWLVNNTVVKSSSVFGEVQSVILDTSMDILSLRGGDANTLTLVVEDENGNAYSKTIYFRVVSVIDTGVNIANPIEYISVTSPSYSLNASVVPINATMQNIYYESSNPSVASVSSTGVISINGTGRVTVTVSSTYGAPSSFTFDVYNPMNSALDLVKVLNNATRPRLQEINSKIKYSYGTGDWWTAAQQTHASSDGMLEAANNSGGSQQTNGYIKYKNLIYSDSYYGQLVFNTEEGDNNPLKDDTIRVNAKNEGMAGNLGTDPLRYIGYNNQGSVTVHLPYNQGTAKVYFKSINVLDNNGEYGVVLPYSDSVTVSYASLNEKLI